jgi:hypothetical protein
MYKVTERDRQVANLEAREEVIVEDGAMYFSEV